MYMYKSTKQLKMIITFTETNSCEVRGDENNFTAEIEN